jgi:hypothetical protein
VEAIMNTLYELYKNVFTLSRGDKEDFYRVDLDDIKTACEKTSMVRTAAGVHDPEKHEDVVRLIDGLEKFIEIDGDISIDSVSVFLAPLSHSAKKLIFRPCQLVGLTQRLYNLAREFKRERDTDLPDVIESIRIDFYNCLQTIKNRVQRYLDERSGHLASNTDGVRSKIASTVLNNMENLIKTGGLSVEQAVDIVDSESFEFEDKDKLIKSIRQYL